jgi:CHAD domain-containing protein
VSDAHDGSGQERFWWDFPEGPLRDRLRDCLEVRALLPLFDADVVTRPVSVVNEDEKTVVRVGVESAAVYDGSRRAGTLHSVLLCPLRGYDREFEAVRGALGESPPVALSFVEGALDLLGRVAGDYTSKLDVELESSMSAREAAGVIFRRLLSTMRRNEPGILADIDTEFVHDFRVAVRRTRSALGQFEGVLPDDVTRRFRKAFRRVGRMTNRLRDLDVYLLQRGRYRGMVPASLAGGLDAVFAAMESERAHELGAVRAALEGEDYGRIVGEWGDTLARFSSLPESENSAVPAPVLARTFIHRRYLRVLQTGESITDTSADDHLHALRIQCKKLRYLLEFFSSLFPDEAGDLVRHLKKLQDNLGEFNDYSVQQASLHSCLDADAMAAASVGALIACLHQEQQRTRRDFAARFDEFAAQENRERFDRLFGPEAS